VFVARVLCPLLAVAGAVSVGGCSATPHGDSVRNAARSFVQKLDAGDGAGACDLLTRDARSSASGATDASCDQAVTGVKEQGGDITSVQVWGDAAEVRIGGDVLFLRLVSGGWRVSAAGCTPQPKGPYDCKLGG
jgi:hypothetical protein